MAIEKKLIHFGRLADFETQLNAGNILDYSIVFIQDAKKIWTHRTYYDCSEAEDVSSISWENIEGKPAEISFLDGLESNIQEQLDDKAEDSGVVHNTGTETINGVKTFNNRVNFVGSGDANAVYLTTDTRIDVYGTTQTVLGFANGTFLINHGNYNLTLRGKGTRPLYNSTEIALSSDIPTKTSALTNDSGFLTEHQDISGKQDAIDDLATIRSGASLGASAVQPSDLSDVATSGSYDDLTDKPTIPSAVTESTVSGWGFTKNTGTITQIKANGTSVATSGVANIPAASTSAYGVTKLSSATNSTSTTLAATASAVKAAYDLANNYKGTVTGVKVNGTTKTPSSGTVDVGNVVTSVKLNGTTYSPSNGIVDLGTISGGGSSNANVQAVDTSETLDDVSGVTYVKYVAQTLTQAQKEQARINIGAAAEGATGGGTVDLSNYYTKEEVDAITGDINSVLESIINGGVSLITFTIDGTVCQAEEGMTWEEWINSDYDTQKMWGIGTNKQIYNKWDAGVSIVNVLSSDVIINNYEYICSDI